MASEKAGRGSLGRVRAVAAWAALTEGCAGIVLTGIGTHDQPRTVLFLLLLALPSAVLGCVTVLIAIHDLRSGAVRTGRLLLLQLLWIGWSQTFGQGLNGTTLVNVVSAIGLFASATVVGASVLDQVARLRR